MIVCCQTGSISTSRRGAGVDLLDRAALRVLDPQADVRADDLAAVGDRRVGDRHLQRVGLQVALADGEVDVVADRPRPVGELALLDADRPRRPASPGSVFCANASLRSSGVGTRPAPSPPTSRPVGAPSPSARAHSWIGPPSPSCDVRLGAHDVEEDVGGDLERALQVDAPVGDVAGVRELDPAVGHRAAVGDRPAGRQAAGVERRQRGDRLEGRAGRIDALGGAVDRRGRERAQRVRRDRRRSARRSRA